VVGFFTSPAGTCVSPPVLLDTGDGDPNDRPSDQKEMPPPQTVICHLIFFYIFKHKYTLLSRSKHDARINPPHFNTAFMKRSVTTYDAVSGTCNNITSRDSCNRP
jgi:hypothetical protein